MSSTDTVPPLEISKKRAISMPFALLVSLLVVVAAGSIAWSAVQTQGRQNASDIKSLQEHAAADHDVLTEIRTDVKSLLREKNPRPDR